MNGDLGSYSFLPWLRQGLANRIETADGDPGVKLRATINVRLDVRGRGLDGADVLGTHARDVALYGPGDVIGIESRAIIQTEPRNWITNFEANYLPYVTFYDEDFPWRYSPAAPDGTRHRLRPWITLVVLTDGEFTDGLNILGRPLPFIVVADTTGTFPAADELWAWAHVHVNRNLIGTADDPRSSNTESVVTAFENVLRENPDLAYSRIVCPRKLEPNLRYHAFVIPTFESGRVAGLGLDPNATPAAVHATFSAWQSYTGRPLPTEYPYYYRWVFRTGSEGDFEFLVRLLKPMPADVRVGRRDLDVQHPGSNIDGIHDAHLGGVLKLGGALQVPFDTMSEPDKEEVRKYDEWAQLYPHPFQQDLARFINLADDYAEKAPEDANHDTDVDGLKNDPDPLITPPLYGRWHALTSRLLTRRDGSVIPHDRNWVHELNLDPRWRCASGFGTTVIQRNQETYMDSAWEQVGQVLDANRLLRQLQLAKQASLTWYRTTVVALAARADDRLVSFASPLHSRVIVGNATAHFQLRNSPTGRALTSAPFRRMLRPRARLMRYSPFTETVRPANLVERVNRLDVTPAPPRTVPAELATVDQVARSLKPAGMPEWLWRLLQRAPHISYLAYLLAIVVFIIAVLAGGLFGVAFGALVAAGLVFLGLVLTRVGRRAAAAASIESDNQTPAAVDALPTSSDFRVAPATGPTPAPPVRTGGRDGEESLRFKDALRDAFGTVQAGRAAGTVPPPTPVVLDDITGATVAAIHPALTIPRFARDWIRIPPSLGPIRPESIEPVMAYPEFDLPMYKPLSDLSTELLVPNLNFIAENSITLLETNQKFIEAYMVGVNHEFARELLWREYPTDQRGSYFRQFWDVAALISDPSIDRAVLRERLKDIPPIHTWLPPSGLGDHDHREARRENDEELVLVIRGELLKKYPTAVIYAQRAKWQRNPDGTIDNTKERRLDDSPPLEANVKIPLYEAKVDPDIYFFGFDLKATEARGGIGDDETDEPGWFFVIQERPGEPRFGFDIERSGALNVWNDLAWPDVVVNPAADPFVHINDSIATLALTPPTGTDAEEKMPQFQEDKFLTWNRDINAAEVAYVLFQAPVLVAVHAADMLPPAAT